MKFLFYLIAIFLFCRVSFAELTARPLINFVPASNPESKSSEGLSDAQKLGCHMAAAYRELLDGAKCSCVDRAVASIPQGDICDADSQASGSTETAAAYKLGARGSIGAEVDLGPEIDCSGADDAAACVAGVSETPGEFCTSSPTTKEMRDNLKSGRGCYDPVQAGAIPNLYPGDRCLMDHGGSAIGHVMRADRVSPDCVITIAQSASSGAHIYNCGSGSGAKADIVGQACNEMKRICEGGASSASGDVTVSRYGLRKCGMKKGKPAKGEACAKKCKVGEFLDWQDT